MDNRFFIEVVDEQIELCQNVLFKKGKEYTPGSDRLSNFRQSASVQNLTMEQALAGMMAKHTISIFDMVWNPDDYPIEQWSEKITDHINYLLILKAIVVEAKLEAAADKAVTAMDVAEAESGTSNTLPPSPRDWDFLGEYVEEFGSETNMNPVPPDGPTYEQAKAMLPHFFGKPKTAD